MYDPDAGHHRPLRLGAPARTEAPEPITDKTDDDLVLEILRVMCHAIEGARRTAAQSQPISAQRPTEQSDRQALARYQEADPLWRLHMGQQDGRVFQHATGPTPLIFRSSGHVERLEAAARGEIGDPAEDLRRERLVMALNGFEPLDAPL